MKSMRKRTTKTSPTKTTVDNGGKDYTNPKVRNGIRSGSIKDRVVWAGASDKSNLTELAS
jgi:hypothetical protein